MKKSQTPENIPRLFDMVRVNDEHVRSTFYFTLRDTLVADNLDQAARVAFQKHKRLRVVTLQGQNIEQSGTKAGSRGKVIKGRTGNSVVVEVLEDELQTQA